MSEELTEVETPVEESQSDVNTEKPKDDGFFVDNTDLTMQEIYEIKRKYEDAAYRLLDEEPFLYCILGNFRFAFNEKVTTAAVSLETRGPVLYLSRWFGSLTLSQRIFVLKHECLHIMLGHIPRSIFYRERHKNILNIHDLLNIAQDLAINPMAKNHLNSNDTLIVDKRLKWPKNYGWEDGLSFPEYFYKMMNDPDMKTVYVPFDMHQSGNPKTGDEEGSGGSNGDEEGSGGSNGDQDGDGNGFGQPLSGEAAAQMNENIVQKAANEFKSRNYGTGSYDVNEILERIYGRKGIHWKNHFRNAMSEIRGGNKEWVRVRPNRRGIKYARGFRKGPKRRVGVVLDVSGSMGNHDVQIAFDEIDKLAKKEEVLLAQVDTEMKGVEKWTKGKAWNRKGCGGTDMTPGFEAMLKAKVSHIICITDGHLPNFPEVPSGVSVFWVCNNEEVKFPYGKVIRVNDEGNWWEN
jgi:predicted metal-dependent peptidase